MSTLRAQECNIERRKRVDHRRPHENRTTDIRAAIDLGSAFLHLGAGHNWRRLFESSLEGFSEEVLATVGL